jgi:glycosyltransferase involved in cell wall biosynthesis
MTDILTRKITIILPVRNEGNYVRSALDAVLSQNYPIEHIEILISDGMSIDNTREIIKDYQFKQVRIFLLDNPGKIVPTGMNIALKQAQGDIIIRVDGHCIIAPDYVRNCVEHLEKDGVDGVGGPMETIGENKLSESIAIAMSSPFGVGNSTFRTVSGKTILADTVPFPAYTKAIIQKAGLYDEELVRNQDDEYNYRIRELGGKLLLADDVRSKYYSRGSFGKLFKQYYQYGFYKVRVLQKHPRQMSLRQFVPLVFVLSLLTSLILSFLSPWGWIPLIIVVGNYLVANFAASLYTAAKKGGQHLLLLPVVFATIHISYGSGFLVGLFKFWNRWGDKVGRVPQISSR